MVLQPHPDSEEFVKSWICIFDAVLKNYPYEKTVVAGENYIASVNDALAVAKRLGAKAREPKIDVSSTTFRHMLSVLAKKLGDEPNPFTCTHCGARGESGCTMCLGCSGTFIYGLVECMIEDDPDEDDADHVAKLAKHFPPMAEAQEEEKPKAKSEQDDYLVLMRDARRMAAMGFVGSIKSEWGKMRKIVADLIKHREKWDNGGWDWMPAKGMFRDHSAKVLDGT